MNARDISRIEKVVGCPLPSSYATLLRRFPKELECLLKLRPKDARMLFTDSATIVKWNTFFRDPNYSYEDPAGELRTFPRRHIVIGATLGGDFFHLDAQRKTSVVLFWSHEDGEVSRFAKTLGEHVRKIFSSAAEAAMDGLSLS